MIVSNNIVYNTDWGSLFQHYGANNTVINNVFARVSLIALPQSGDPSSDGDIRIQAAESHTSWTYTRNIVYDTFQGANHSVFISDPNRCDFFTIQANSPTAKLGFVNLTKLPKWTPGCDAETIYTQFYHW